MPTTHQTSPLPPPIFDLPNPQPNIKLVHEPPRTHPMITRLQSGIVKPIDRLSSSCLMGTLSRYKARLVANGSSQQLGVDFDETFLVRIKRLLDDLRVTAAKVYVTDAKHKLVLRDGLEVADGYANNEGKEILEECWKKSYCEWAPRNQENRNRENTRRVVPVETTTSNDLISCDGLESVEARLLVYKKNESIYEEDIKLLKREIYLKEVAITELRRKLELAQKQKDEIQLTVENFENSSKNLSKLLDCQIVDKCKIGLGYNAVPPPYTGNFMPPKPDLSFSGLEEFVNEPIVSEPTVKKPVVETSEAKASADKPKAVKKNNGAPIIEDWVSDSEEEDMPQAKIQKKIVKPSFAKIKFVKSKEQVKTPLKTTVKQGSNFEMINKACYVCGSFDHLQYDCNNHQRQFNNKKMVKPVWNYTQRVNHQIFSRMTHPSPKRNMVQKAVLMRYGLVSFTTVRPVNTAQPRSTVNSARPMTNVFNKAHSTVRRPINNKTTTKNSNFTQRVNTVMAIPQNRLYRPRNDGLVGCSRYMIGYMSYLTNFEEIDGGYVALGGNPKGGKIIGRDRTPQQNGASERKNRTLIEAVRTMLADSKLPTTFWAEVVNTACYVKNRVLVTKPHNKTPYELFLGRKSALGFMRPFRCPVTILNTIDHFGKFDDKADEGFFVGYSINSKAFRVFNIRTRIVEENLHVQFSENIPNIVGSGPKWLFDIDALKKSMNYKPVIVGNQSNDDDEDVGVEADMNNLNKFMHMDVKSAFLYGKIEEEVYVCQTPGFEIKFLTDDIIFGSTKKSLCNELEKMMHKKFQIRSMGELTFFIGLQTASTPMETQKPLLKDEDGEEVDVHLYRSMIGLLMYLTSSKPDIMLTVCACARYQVNPKVSHLLVVIRIFSKLGRKSIIGGCQFLGCRLISWQCKKQTVVANSTTEAEYVASSSCCGQVLWIQNQLLDYGYNFMHTKIYIDNESTICIVKNPVFHSKTKHIEIRHHFIRDSNEKKLIQMIKIHTDKNVADLLTKAFDVSRFQYLIASIGMLNL
ncbi:ribonuclease H-like domain-containing protein [Tanacetum coccineum]